jgi:hypothetical protein
MKKLSLLAAAAVLVNPLAASASYYNATFDCGHGQIVWIGNPATGSPKSRKAIFDIELSELNFNNRPIRSPVIKWTVTKTKNEVTSDGRRCREMTEVKERDEK